MKENPEFLREYNKGFDYGLTVKIHEKILAELKPQMLTAIGLVTNLRVKAYWQGYYDAIHGYMRNSEGDFMNAPMPVLTTG